MYYHNCFSSYYAVDGTNGISSTETVTIYLCPGCINGVCDYNTGVVNSTSQLFYTVPCKCDTGWTGELPLGVKAVAMIQVWSIPRHSYSTLYHVNVTQDGQVSYL